MKKNRVKMMTWLMIAAITAQNTVPAMAGTEPGNRAQTEDRKQEAVGEGADEELKAPALSRPATPSDAEEPSGEPSEEPGGDSEKGEPDESQEEPDESPENMEPPQEESEPAFSLEGMPEIGSREFTDWFAEHTDQEELWEYILSILERGEDEEKKDKEYQALIGWITEHEALFSRAYQAHIGKAFELSAYRISSTGDLWDEWESVMDWDGTGRRKTRIKLPPCRS